MIRRTTILIVLFALVLALFLLACAGSANLSAYSVDDRVQATCVWLATVTAK